MKLLILSDFHLCNGDHFGKFNWNCNELISILDSYVKLFKINKIILNGDIFELYKYRYKYIYLHNKPLIDYLRSQNAIFIRGNHDSIFRDSIDNINFISSKNELIHIEHGHEADFNSIPTIRILCRIGLKILRVITKNKSILRIYNRIHSNYEFNEKRKKNSVKYLEYAIRLLKNHYDVVILGHSHELRKHKFYYKGRRKLYFSCGTVTNKKFQGLLIDTETMEHILFKDLRSLEDKQHIFNHDRLK